MAFSIEALTERTELAEKKLRELEAKLESLTKSQSEEKQDNVGSLKFYYWPLKNRGNTQRLLLAESGVKFEDIGDGEQIKANVACKECLDKSKFEFDSFAVPALNHNGKMIGQGPAVTQYIAQITGMRPKSDLDNALAHTLLLNIEDIFKEIFQNKEKPVEELEKFLNGRFQLWLDVLEKPLIFNGQNKNYYFENRCTQADIGVANSVDGFHELFKDKYDYLIKSKHPALHALYERVMSRKAIKQYIDGQNKKGMVWIPASYFGEFWKKLESIKTE